MSSSRPSFKARMRKRKQVRRLLPAYHKVRAVIAHTLYFFPARHMKVIAVTGTDGKTTTVSYIASILEAAGYRVGVSSTAYYRIGKTEVVNDSNMTVVDPFRLAHLLFKMRIKRVRWVVLEVTAHSLSQNRIWGVPIHTAVMTNVSSDHLDYYGTMHKYAAAKSLLFKKKPPNIVLNRDDEWFDYYDGFPAKEHKMSYGTKSGSNCQIVKAKLQKNGSTFDVILDTVTRLSLSTSHIGKFNVYNAAAAIATGYLLHIDQEAIVEGVAGLGPVAGRMEFVEAGQDYSVVVDYAHTPVALESALETIKGTTTSRIILVFGATGDRDRSKRPEMGAVAVRHASTIILTDEDSYGEDPQHIRSQVMKGIEKARGISKTAEVPDRRAGIEKALGIAKKGDTVLITGMGHQEHMIVDDKKIPWNDAQVVREIISEQDKKS